MTGERLQPVEGHANQDGPPALRSLPGLRIVAARSRGEWVRAAAMVGWLLGPAYWLLRLNTLPRRRGASRRAERWWLRSARALLGMRIDVSGLEYIDPHEPYVVVALHEGLADPIALSTLPLHPRYLVIDELFEWPWLGSYLERSDHVRVPVDDGVTSLLAIREALRSEESIVIFPQGSVLGIELGFHDGAARIARIARRRLLPVVVTGTHRVWGYPFTSRLRFGCRVSIRVLPPVPAEEAVASFLALERSMRARAFASDVMPPRRFVPARDGYWDGYPYRVSEEFPRLAREIAERRRQSSTSHEARANDHTRDVASM